MLRRRLTSQIVSHIKYFLANIFFSSLKYFFATCYGGGWQLRTVSRTNWRTGTATGQSCGCYLRWPEQHHKWIILRNFVDTFTSWAWARSPWDICHSWAPACRARWRWLRWCWRRSSRTSACWGRGRWRGHPSTPVMPMLLLLSQFHHSTSLMSTLSSSRKSLWCWAELREYPESHVEWSNRRGRL